eukprot:356036-Chlamydomonas_euryale.AAC.6
MAPIQLFLPEARNESHSLSLEQGPSSPVRTAEATGGCSRCHGGVLHRLLFLISLSSPASRSSV